MKRLFGLSALTLAIAAAFLWMILHSAERLRAGVVQAQTPPPPAIDEALRTAVAREVQAKRPSALGMMIYDTEVNEIFYSADGRTALIWLQFRDPDTGEVIGTEPGLAIARNPQGFLAQSDEWQVTLQTARDFARQLTSLPAELRDPEVEQFYLEQREAMEKAAVQTFTGYKLPWSKALNIKITGSVGHFLDYNSCSETYCRYAYDFWNPDSTNRMFPLLASKGGVVKAYKESCPNGSTSCTNYLVLQDDSTVPTTYQLYYHLAYNSIPDNLTVGTYVPQGTYIGNVDDTGYSSDHHLHFHVYTSPTNSAYSWGASVRILFSDVPFNGGEPRTCAETINHPSYGTECSMGADGKKGGGDDDYLVSSNFGSSPPTGSLDTPFPWATLTTRTLSVSGTARDNLGIARVQVLVNYDGIWRTLGNADVGSGVFAKDFDLCSAGIPDGPISLAVRIFDVEGNWADRFTGLRQIFKNASCSSSSTPPPAPACTPSSGQIGVYAEPQFGGACLKLGAGQHNASVLGTLNNAIQSVQVASGTCATLYEPDNANPFGRSETFNAADANLSDNRIGAKTVSSIVVQPCTNQVDEPFLTFPGNLIDPNGNSATTPNPANPMSTDSLVLAWTGGEGAPAFTARLLQGSTEVKSMPAANTHTWSVGNLPAGTYTWIVTAQGQGTTNSTDLTFTVDAASLPESAPLSAPVTFDFEGDTSTWTATGLWSLRQVERTGKPSTKAWAFSNGTSFNDSTYRAGDLTSPPITLPADQTAYLRFKSFSDVEGWVYSIQTFGSKYYDQRRVQISVDGGAFTDLYQFNDDSQHILWLDSPAISLDAYKGRTVRIRFHFDTVDALINGGYGWAVDDVSITTDTPPNCADGNNSPATAQPIAFGQTLTDLTICPGGDVDYYSFSGSAGATVRIDLNAYHDKPGSVLDTFVSLLDSSGVDVVAENDDEKVQENTDSLIVTTLPRTGTYYIRVRAWNHPGAGDANHLYDLNLSAVQNGAVRPLSLTLTQPPDPKKLPIIPFIVETAVQDDPLGGGITRVDFYWHPADWQNRAWVKFASDTTPADGWWAIFNPTEDTSGSAFYILAINASGGSNGLLIADLQPDKTAPSSALDARNDTVNSTAVYLTWQAQDYENDIERFEFQYRAPGGAWQNYPAAFPAHLRGGWFLLSPGKFEFQMRAVDQAGNVEDYPDRAEAVVTFNGACTPDAFDASDGVRGSGIPVQLLNAAPTERRLCQNDVDWVAFDASAGEDIGVLILSQGGGAAVQVRLYAAGNAVPLLEQSARGLGESTALRWKAPASGRYELEIRAVDARLWGEDVRYRLYVGNTQALFLPLIGR